MGQFTVLMVVKTHKVAQIAFDSGPTQLDTADFRSMLSMGDIMWQIVFNSTIRKERNDS